MSEAELKKIINQRGALKAQLSRFNTYLDNFVASPESQIELQTRLDAVTSLLDKFNELQEKIELLDETVSEQTHLAERGDFESKYFNRIARAKILLNESPRTSLSTAISNSVTDASTSGSQINVKLPQINLPEFGGSYEGWTQFRDTFDALINKNEGLSKIQKFYYLQSSLKNEAAHVISSLNITESNYDIAWQLLTERYENKKAIVNAHIKGIFELPAINRESHVVLRRFLDSFLKHYRALICLDDNVNHWDTILIYILSSKLDMLTKREWESCSRNKEHPTIEDFTKQITQRCQILESINPNVPTKQPLTKSLTHISTNKISCPVCQAPHYIYECKKFRDLPVNDRLAEVKRLKLCTNCLRLGHLNSECRSRGCKTCQGRHNSLLHFYQASNESRNSQSHVDSKNQTNNQNKIESRIIHNSRNSQEQNSENATNALYAIGSHCGYAQSAHVFLSTAVVIVYDSKRNMHHCRALLDNGSQSNFITSSFSKRLGLKAQKIELPVVGISQVVTNITDRMDVTIKSNHSEYKTRLPFLIIDKIADLIPQVMVSVSNLNVPSGIPLADPKFNQPSSIDMLLGASIFFQLLCIGQISLGRNQPTLQKTKLGWIISGQTNISPPSRTQSCFLTNNCDISNQIENFWRIEEHQALKVSSKEDLECERHFVENTFRDNTGRFVVKLPLRENYLELGESEENALNRFYSIEKRLKKNPELKRDYYQFMSEYEIFGHMTRIQPTQKLNGPAYYLPQHCVEKRDSTTTKLRVVFDASSKTSSGISLNDVLKVGPSIQNDLLSILLRFRKHNIVIIGDLEKMYRQILVHSSQRHLQRIFWRTDENSKLEHFELNTVTYGTASASFLATRCIHQLALDNHENFPVESKIIMNDMYVDDLLTGSHDKETAIHICQSLIAIFKQAGFVLRKFSSNNTDVLTALSLGESDAANYLISNEQSTKTLGVTWNPTSDRFEYNSSHMSQSSNKITKRTILSVIAQVFDPLGLLGPLTIQAKVILQKLWKEDVGWDESISTELYTLWSQFTRQLDQVKFIHIPRHIFLEYFTNVQLHGFCDASEQAYGACIYARSENNKGEVSVHLVCAKSRVAPLKALTMPRLELCGAVLLVQLMDRVSTSLDMKFDDVKYWTDSSIVLCWIAKESRTWQAFVSNRVGQIQNLSSTSDWYHVPSELNPADIISRGMNPIDINGHRLWWNGPSFLLHDSNEWPQLSHDNSSTYSDIPEMRRHAIFMSSIEKCDLFDRYSNLTTLQRVTAFVLRFIKNTKLARDSRILGKLTIQEISHASEVLVILVQRISFAEEYKLLEMDKSLQPSSKLIALDPFIDNHGIIRVGGRLKHSHLSFTQKHPAVLPEKHPFTQLIIRSEHIRNLHAGQHATLSFVRQKYWPLNGRKAVKSVIRKCIPCFRARPTTIYQKMGELPSPRVTPARIFSSCGIDYAGPFPLKDGKTRNRKIIKSYVCIFICLSSKAIHLELVTDLSTEAFMNALKRFVSRRGLCSHIYSDNATNFSAAARELKQIHHILKGTEFQNYVDQFQIEWHFIPANSPHFGGLWEAAVRSVKHHLKRAINSINLTFEEFYTFLTQIEAVLNSRPLVPLSNDPRDLEPLTPGHFILGEPLNVIPRRDDNESFPSGRNITSRYQHIVRMVNYFWSRWTKDYLHHLQQRCKWKVQGNAPPLEGALVILKETNTPPASWPMGRIIATHPGSDGISRVVSVKTRNGVVKRALAKVCVLPVSE